MYIIMEGLVMSFILLISCVVAIANGPVGGVALYEDDVQKRVVEWCKVNELELNEEELEFIENFLNNRR